MAHATDTTTPAPAYRVPVNLPKLTDHPGYRAASARLAVAEARHDQAAAAARDAPPHRKAVAAAVAGWAATELDDAAAVLAAAWAEAAAALAPEAAAASLALHRLAAESLLGFYRLLGAAAAVNQAAIARGLLLDADPAELAPPAHYAEQFRAVAADRIAAGLFEPGEPAVTWADPEV